MWLEWDGRKKNYSIGAETLILTEKQQKEELEALVAKPDSEIDLSDIPEIADWSGAVRGKFARPETRYISIRLSGVDLIKAEQLAAARGVPCQTYIKSLLHEALERESAGRA